MELAPSLNVKRLYIRIEEMSSIEELFVMGLKGPLSDLLGLRTEAKYSLFIEQNPIQDAFRYRAKYLGLRIASLLILEDGELNRTRLEEILAFLENGCFVLGPGREGDILLYRHIQICLKNLSENKEIWLMVRKFSPPLCHKKAEDLIRETLYPEEIRTLQTAQVRKAVLASWLTFLRQATGSCFATAPAILIQQNEPLLFFKDLYDLLSTGQMKRVIAGKEYSVPLSFTSGVGDLNKIISAPSFGLVVALESVGASADVSKEEPQTVQQVIRAALLKAEGLSDEDFREEELLSRIQMTPLLAKQSAIYYQKPSLRSQKIADWKKKYEKACLAFKAITECALLRAWEYSLASFSDLKTDFARWNLFIGLGLHPDQKNGIGAFLYEEINSRLQKCYSEIERLAKEYEYEASVLQSLEVMIQSASSEMRLNQLKAEWMSHSGTANSLMEMRDKLMTQSEGLTGLFAWLIERFYEKLQEFFQELFDPALAAQSAHLYDDSPAGFRLIYKHGRADASQWTAIHDRKEYIESLRDFFTRIESELPSLPNVESELISEILTSLIQFIQTDEFFEGASSRSKEKGRLSPWDYISGGTLQTLLMAYFNRDHPFKETGLIPQSEEELLRFLSAHKGAGPLLMHSPTHAFLFLPHLLENRLLRAPKKQEWAEEMREHFVHRLSEKLPEEEKALFLHLFKQKIVLESKAGLRSAILESISPRVKFKELLVDGAFYENAWLFDAAEAKKALEQIFKAIGFGGIQEMTKTFFGPHDLFTEAKKQILQRQGQSIFSTDWDQKIADEMRKMGLLPDALLFADTNWSHWFFGFVLNPVTDQLELWRLNRTATQGFPMRDWKEWLKSGNTSAWVLITDRI